MCAPQTDPQAPLLNGSTVPGPAGAGGPGSPDNAFMCMETPGTTGVNDASTKNYSGEYTPVTATCMAMSAVPFPRPWALKAIRIHEGYKRFMYLDSKSYITIGIGWNLMSTGDSVEPPAEAVNLPWLERKTGKPPADPARSVQNAWTKLRGISPFGKPQTRIADSFEDETDIYIDDSGSKNPILARFDKHIALFTAELRSMFKNFDSFPVPAREALLDMSMMGTGLDAQAEIKPDPAHGIKGQKGRKASGLRAYILLRGAAEKHDWKEAAQQCNRDVDERRNAWTRKLFLEAIGWECAEAG